MPASEAASAAPARSGQASSAFEPEPVEEGPSLMEKLATLVRERPEVGLGIAFTGGILLATILKRLAR